MKVSIVEFKATVSKTLKEHDQKFTALKVQIDEEMESYRRDPTQDIRAMIDSQNKKLMELGVSTATAIGKAFDETGLTKKAAPELYAATESICDQLNAQAVEYLKELNKATQALPKMIPRPRSSFLK